MSFEPTYLYIKQHAVTGKLYFGKTTQDPDAYLGSGTRWVPHVKKHGKEHVVNLWYELFTSKDEIREFALSFSKDMNIVESEQWLNLMPENGLDGVPKGTNKDKVVVKDEFGNIFQVSKSDPHYISGKLVQHTKGLVVVKDKFGKFLQVDKDDIRIKSGELNYQATGRIVSKITRDKRSISLKDREFTIEHCIKISIALNGIKHSIERNKKNALSNIDLHKGTVMAFNLITKEHSRVSKELFELHKGIIYVGSTSKLAINRKFNYD